MAVTRDELQSFQRFVDERIANGGADSILELATQWEAVRGEMEQAVSDIRESHEDIDHGRTSSVRDAFLEARQKLELE